MTLQEYLQKKIIQQAVLIAASAPMDSCPDCNVCEGVLIYNAKSNIFQYKCRCCGLTWSTDHLVVDESGRFQMLELAD